MISKKNKGFTILEMITVISIIGIVAAIAIPNFIGYRVNMRLRSATADLLSNIKKSQINAISRRHFSTGHSNCVSGSNWLYAIQFNASNVPSYQVVSCGCGGTSCANISPSDDIVKYVQLDQGQGGLRGDYPGIVFLSNYTDRIVCEPDGTFTNFPSPKNFVFYPTTPINPDEKIPVVNVMQGKAKIQYESSPYN